VLADDTPEAIRARSGSATLEQAFMDILGGVAGLD
jgi:hypothetical protein